MRQKLHTARQGPPLNRCAMRPHDTCNVTARATSLASGLLSPAAFGTPGKNSFDRRTHRLVRAMNAANPTTRSTLPFLELIAQPLKMLFSGLLFLDGGDPTDPLVARQRRQALPCSQDGSIRSQALSQVSRQLVDSAAGDGALCHGWTLTEFWSAAGQCAKRSGKLRSQALVMRRAQRRPRAGTLPEAGVWWWCRSLMLCMLLVRKWV